MINEVDGLVDLEEPGHVVVDEEEICRAVVLDVLQRPCLEVVDADHPVAAREQLVAEVGAEEAGSAGHDGRRHNGSNADNRSTLGTRRIAGDHSPLSPSRLTPIEPPLARLILGRSSSFVETTMIAKSCTVG